MSNKVYFPWLDTSNATVKLVRMLFNLILTIYVGFVVPHFSFNKTKIEVSILNNGINERIMALNKCYKRWLRLKKLLIQQAQSNADWAFRNGLINKLSPANKISNELTSVLFSSIYFLFICVELSSVHLSSHKFSS